MRVLYLTGPYGNDAILSYLRSLDEVTVWQEPLEAGSVEQFIPYEWAVSCNYKYLIPTQALDLLPHVVNCHISYLPWNRGSQPNFWAWKTGTPHGVSLHRVDAGIDTGPIYAQHEVHFAEGGRDETLATSHARLQAELYRLFTWTWPLIRSGRLLPKPQPHRGSFHDRAAFAAVREQFLTNGWDTPVHTLVPERVLA